MFAGGTQDGTLILRLNWNEFVFIEEFVLGISIVGEADLAGFLGGYGITDDSDTVGELSFLGLDKVGWIDSGAMCCGRNAWCKGSLRRLVRW